mmetsp:Transcript_159758/g.508530  ORF Transcript_159758/g.508530 Transcript_159758/m.508530 type:complete len:292 (+) Transcript_159758:104-979(+)
MGGALSSCSPGISAFLEDRQFSTAAVLGLTSSSSNQALVLRVEKSTTEASLGAVLGGFRVGDTLALDHLRVPDGFEPLGARFREGTRSRWPETYRFQVSRRSWRVNVRSESGTVQSCVLQCAVLPQERTLANAELDFVDAGDAVAYASRFNSHQQQQAEGETAPTVKVAVPAVCSVVESCFPAMIPQGTACTLTPFPDVDVQKFVFDGTEDFLELPQTFFHYAAFSSNGQKALRLRLAGYPDGQWRHHSHRPRHLAGRSAQCERSRQCRSWSSHGWHWATGRHGSNWCKIR